MRSIGWLVALAACGSGLRDDRFPTGSNTLAMSRDKDAVYAVNVDEGSLTRLTLGSSQVKELDVGKNPARVARVGDEVWVTLRGERAVAVVVDHDGVMKVDEVLPVGVEPVGIVASEDGKRVYVANTLSDSVTEFDGRSREELRTFSVQDQPTWLALHPSGKALFVGSALDGTVSRVELASGNVSDVELPEGTRNTNDGVIDLDNRVSGDLAISPDGTSLAIPTVYADTTTSVDEPETPEEPVVDGYGSGGVGIGVGRINPVLVVVELGPDAKPEGKPEAVFLATAPIAVSERSGEVMTTTDSGPSSGPSVFRSYPTSVVSSPSSNEWLITMEASNAVVVVSNEGPREKEGQAEPSFDFASTGSSTDCDGCGKTAPFTSAEQAGFVTWSAVAVTTAAGPKGVLFDEEEHALVHGWLARSVESVPYDDVDAMLESLARNEFDGTLTSARGAVELTRSSLPADVEEGRRMFFSALDQRMAANSAGVSCSTCHMDGRNDGFTWTLQGEHRNTPSLAGDVAATAPVTWSEEVASVADEAMLTTSLRMGGNGLRRSDALLVEAYVNYTPYPDSPRAGQEGGLVAEGREIFEREDVGCASCHGGELYTDTLQHQVRGDLPTQTPTLRGIAASAPYYHDGSAPNLAAVVASAADGSMGDTSMLSASERAALVAFLESL
jgi:DNA-binding beta-propeller fold protein YncE/mono/diheme cytochrome c family protein